MASGASRPESRSPAASRGPREPLRQAWLPRPAPYPLFQQVLLVKLQGVELDGEAAGVLHRHFGFVAGGVRQERPKLQHAGVELQAGLQALPGDVQQQLLGALGDTQDQVVAVEPLRKATDTREEGPLITKEGEKPSLLPGLSLDQQTRWGGDLRPRPPSPSTASPRHHPQGL